MASYVALSDESKKPTFLAALNELKGKSIAVHLFARLGIFPLDMSDPEAALKNYLIKVREVKKEEVSGLITKSGAGFSVTFKGKTLSTENKVESAVKQALFILWKDDQSLVKEGYLRFPSKDEKDLKKAFWSMNNAQSQWKDQIKKQVPPHNSGKYSYYIRGKDDVLVSQGMEDSRDKAKESAYRGVLSEMEMRLGQITYQDLARLGQFLEQYK